MDTARFSTLVLSIFFIIFCHGAISDSESEPGSAPAGGPADGNVVTRQTDPERFERIATAPERSIGEDEDIVTQYETGIWLDITEPLDGSETSVLRNGSGSEQLQIINDLIAAQVSNSSRFRLNEGLSIAQTDVGDVTTTLDVMQNINSHQLSALKVRIPTTGDAATINISGILVDPSLPQLDQTQWTDETSAQELAIVELKQYAGGMKGSWFWEANNKSEIKGVVTIDVNWSNELTVQPIYTVVSDEAIAQVNLYTGEVTSGLKAQGE